VREVRNAYKMMMGKPLESPEREFYDSIRVDLREMGCKD
jgi:hypothetical protein